MANRFSRDKDGKVHYSVKVASAYLGVSAAKVKGLMAQGVLEWTQLRTGGIPVDSRPKV